MAVQLEIADAIEIVQDLWREDTSLTVSESVVKKYLKSAVRHVEFIDFKMDNEWTIDDSDNITFSTTPSNQSFMLYAYRCLVNIYDAYLNGDVVADGLGISWRSGMDQISTATAGRIKTEVGERFYKRYRSALREARMKTHTPTAIDLYDE